ncbi:MULTISPECIES: TetR/AcrR family transcriptional regulator [unclassified Roseitalea]|uniref:TetR/AcrR family transcriptional regulator n=1 Tax=unclassified Roseitalea TaxID=2639107 RepID=UPI00273DE012|nr:MULTISPECIES: TetR/AcrR family transcriptional regulator [unclassified Roseitalea]
MDQIRPKTRRGQKRREQILRAAERVFGRLGYAEASISDITREAETAQGTLYIYFSGKDEIFSELVREMGHLTRIALAGAVADAPTRLEAERRGLAAFLRFVADRPELYRIVEEARFVDPKAYEAYFSDFARAYRANLDAAGQAGEIRTGDSEIRAWALMGMAKTLGERFVLWRRDVDIDTVVAEAFDLIENGLRT